MQKLFLDGNKKNDSSYIKFFHEFLDQLEKSGTDRRIVRLIVRSVVSFGPKKFGNNLLCFNFAKSEDTLFGRFAAKDPRIKAYFGPRKKQYTFDYGDKETMESYFHNIQFGELKKSLENGFEVTLENGPLCGEEMSGVVFFVEDFKSVRKEKEHE